MPTTTVVFTIPIFKAAPNGYFQKPAGHEAAYTIKLGDVEAALPLAGIAKEFNVDPQSEDGQMLTLVDRALDFVTVLRLGDTMPTEVLTGEPSWEITADHRLRAYQRLSLQLATWITGEERVLTNAAELAQIAEDPNNKKRWNQAFDEAARRLGFEENGREQVMALVANLAEEIAYIEALRDRYDEIVPIDQQVNRLRKLYSAENSVREIADAVARLMDTAKERLTTRFEEIDAQTGEILSVLRKPEQQVVYIRSMRDDLYCCLTAWQDMITRWSKVSYKRDEKNVALLRDSYRFLAPRYMPVVEWVRTLDPTKKPKNATAVSW